MQYVLCAVIAVLSASRTHAHPGLHHDIARVTEVLREHPDRTDLLIQRGRLYRLDGNMLASLADLNRAWKRDAENPAVLLQRGLTLSALRRDADADADLTRCLQQGDGWAVAYAERGRIRARRGRREAAVADFSAALRKKDDIEIYLARGKLQEILGRLDEAGAGYRVGLSRLRGAVLLRLALIRVETARKRYDEALTLIDDVLARVPVKTDWYLRRAEVLSAAGDKAGAQRDLDRALAEADDAMRRRPTAINLLSRAKVYLAMGRKTDASRDLRTALQKTPRFAQARTILDEIEHGRKQTGRLDP